MLHHMLRAAAGRDRIPTDGLIAHYTMDNISGSTLVDETGNYNGTITGATQVPGHIGQALDFDGANDWVDLPSALTASVKAISLWINPDDITARQFFVMHRNGGTDSRIYITIFENNIEFFYGTGIIASSPISLNTWTHLAFNIEPSSQEAYKGGGLISSGTNTYSGTDVGIVLGRYDQKGGTTPVQYANGKEDQVFFYNRFLTPGEIADLAAQ